MRSTDTKRSEEESGMKWHRYIRKAGCMLAGLAVAAAMIPLSASAQNDHSKLDEDVFTVDVALDGGTLIVNRVDPVRPRRHDSG